MTVEKIHTLPPLFIFFTFSPAFAPFTDTPLIALLHLLFDSSQNFVIIRWERDGQRAWGGREGYNFLSLCMTFSDSFNINSRDSEIWMLRIQTEAAGTLTALLLRLMSACFEILNPLWILLSVSLSSLMNGIKFKRLGFYKTYPTPSVGSLVIELGQQTCLPHKFIYTAVDIGYPICTVGNVAWQCAICAVCTWALVQQYKQCPELCVGKRMFFFLKLTSLFFTPSFSQPPFFFCFWVYLCARACIWHLSGGLRVMPWSCRRTRPQLHARSEMPSVKLHPSACHSVRQETI